MARWNYEKSQWEVKDDDNWVKQKRAIQTANATRVVKYLKNMRKKLKDKDKQGNVKDSTGVSLCAIGKKFNESVPTIKRRINHIAKEMVEHEYKDLKPTEADKLKKWRDWVEEQAVLVSSKLTGDIPDYTAQEIREKTRQEDEGFTGADLWDHFNIKKLKIPEDF